MSESSRIHERIVPGDRPVLHLVLDKNLPRPVDVFLADRFRDSSLFDLLIHFHGADFILADVAARADVPLIAVSVSLGSGSSVYGRPFETGDAFRSLIDSILSRSQLELRREVTLRRIILSGWSAGYGSVRAIMHDPWGYERVNEVMLLDGVHADYIPDRLPLAEGGIIDSTDLNVFLQLARDASSAGSAKKFLVTHSEVFPGTFASTTECIDYLLSRLNLSRTSVLHWGPMGTQQLSWAGAGHFLVIGMAGNSAPDHVDHLHALSEFLEILHNL